MSVTLKDVTESGIWVSSKEACALLGVTRGTLTASAARGSIQRRVSPERPGWYEYLITRDRVRASKTVQPPAEWADAPRREKRQPQEKPAPQPPKKEELSEEQWFGGKDHKPGDKPAGPSITTEVDEYGMTVTTTGDIASLEDLLKAASVDTDKWEVVDWKPNVWQNFFTDGAGHARKVNLHQVKARLCRKPESFVNPVKYVDPPKYVAPAVITNRMPRALIVPDTQHGHYWDFAQGKLFPMHDRRGIDAVIQLAELLQPELVVFIGDHLDLPELSTKYPREPKLVGTTNPSIWECGHDLQRVRAACPNSQIIFLDGNHEDRMNRLLVERAPALQGITSFNREKELRDLLSFDNLLGLSELDIEHVTPYGKDWWWRERVRFVHDDGVKSGGGKTSKYSVSKATHTTVFGHIHRVEMAPRTVNGPRGPRRIYSVSPGCLCRLEPGSVPAANYVNDWQHGVAVIDLGDDCEFVHLKNIENGVLVWDDQVITGVDRTAEIAEAIGFPLGSADDE
jgi:hypothetical protein